MRLPLVSAPPRGFTSFADAPVCTDLERLEADVAVLGAPYGIPYGMGQCRSFGAPDYLREHSLRFARVRKGACALDTDRAPFAFAALRLVDCGNIVGDPLDVPGTVARTTEAVRAILARGALPVVLGGDDAIPIPVARAYESCGPIVVIQIDEHLDYAEDVGGVREGYSSPMRRISEMPWVERVIQIGLHGFAPEDQWRAAGAAGHLLITEGEVHRQGIPWVLEQVPAGARYLVTCDFDGLDPAVCPAVSHPEPGGLTWPETLDLYTGLASRGQIVGLDFAEFVPAHDLHGHGGHAAARLILDTLHAMQQAGRLPLPGRPRPA